MEEKLQSPPPQPQSTPNIDALLARLSQTGGYDLEKVKKAYDVAEEYHRGQMRRSG